MVTKARAPGSRAQPVDGQRNIVGRQLLGAAGAFLAVLLEAVFWRCSR